MRKPRIIPNPNSRLMTIAELRQRLILAMATRQPALYVLAKLTGIQQIDLKRYRNLYEPCYERRLILTDLFRKIDLGIYELYQRPMKKGDHSLIWDLRISTDPKPPVSACVTFSKNGPKLRFKSTAELMGYEQWQPHESAKRPSSKPIAFSKSTVV